MLEISAGKALKFSAYTRDVFWNRNSFSFARIADQSMFISFQMNRLLVMIYIYFYLTEKTYSLTFYHDKIYYKQRQCCKKKDDYNKLYKAWFLN